MRRRELIALVGGAMAWPAGVRAQQPTMPVIGFLNAGARGTARVQHAAFGDGLKESGYVEGQSVAIEHRYAEGQFDRMSALATIPIVFGIGGDPVALGLVSSLNRPGSNITGIYFFTQGLEAKRLGLLHELVPSVATIAVLVNPDYQPVENQLRDVKEAATRLGVQLVELRANNEREFDGVFKTLTERRAGGLLVAASPFFYSSRGRLVALAARHAVPAIYEWREFADAGGLMTYGSSLADAYRQAGVYVGRILKGAKPADLPVVQTTKFELVINLKTAKALSVTVPQSLIIQANDMIE